MLCAPGYTCCLKGSKIPPPTPGRAVRPDVGKTAYGRIARHDTVGTVVPAEEAPQASNVLPLVCALAVGMYVLVQYDNANSNSLSSDLSASQMVTNDMATPPQVGPRGA